ncbi:MAG TPA: antitoxin [Thermoanaerobaculia bacterium]
MPRTTIDIDDPVLDDIKALQEREKKSLGALVSELLAEALAARRRRAPEKRIRWKSRAMDALVSLEDKEALWAILDGEKGRRRG